MDSNSKDFNLNSTNIILMVWNKRKLLMWVGVIAFVVSIIASFLIKPMFKATAIVYAPITSQVSKELLTEPVHGGLTAFGEGEESEQVLQVLSSNTLRDIVIKKLNLMPLWGINPNEKYAKHKTYGIFSENIKFRPTEFSSVEVEVMDATPEMSAKIANTIVQVEDSLMLSIKAQVSQKSLLLVEDQYIQCEQELRSLEDSLSKVMSNGVINLQAQTQEFFRTYAKMVAKNDVAAIKALDKKMEPLKKYGSKYTRLIDEVDLKVKELTLLNESRRIARIEASQKIPSQFVVDWATVPDKKAYPKKSIVVILSTLSALFFAVVSLIVVDFFKRTIKE